ncbi:putative RNA helicase armi isoform 2-T5 [Glossina fuscipes fuscipes]
MIREENSREARGVFFPGMRSEDMQGEDSPSWYNPYQVKHSNCMKSVSIGIITPFMKQAKHLRKLFGVAEVAMPTIGAALNTAK